MDRKRPTSGNAVPTDRSRETPAPSFDEGERRPTAIEHTGDDGVRPAIERAPAEPKGREETSRGDEPDATMPPGQGRDPKRNTL